MPIYIRGIGYLRANPAGRSQGTNPSQETDKPSQSDTTNSTQDTDNLSQGTDASVQNTANPAKDNTIHTNKVIAVMSAEETDKNVKKINNTANGGKIKVVMGTAKIIPVEILEALRGKDVDIILDMGEYSWTINGKDIIAEELKTINLGVNLDQNAIAQSVVDTVADGQPTRQLSLDYSGEFVFKAYLNLNLGAENAGLFGNLYYYDNTGKLVFMNAGKIDENGNVALAFTHASDYVIVIDKDRTFKETGHAPKTGEDTPIIPISIIVIALIELWLYLPLKKRTK